MRRIALTALLFSLAVAPAVAQAPSTEVTQVGATESRARAGDEITIQGQGWASESQVMLRIEGRPLAATTAGFDGRFRRDVLIPGDLEPGAYEITAEGTDARGQPTTLTFMIEVAEPTPRGTFVILAIVAAVTLAIFLVAMIWFFGKRRRTSLAEAADAGETPVRNPDPRDAPQPEDARRR